MPTPSTLFKDVTAGRFKPAYYFFGSEDYRIAEAEKFVAMQFLPHLQMATNLYRIDARKTRAPDLMAELANLPMLGEKQVFVVRDFQSYRADDVKQVLKLLSPADPNRIIIFSTPSARTPRRNSAFFNSISKAAEAIEFKKLSYQESAAIIQARLKKEDLTIAPEALRLLTELVAGSRGALEAELTKLVNYKESGDKIEVADIRSVSAGYEVFGIFDLADQVVAGDAKKVFNMVRSLLAEGNSPATLIALMQQHFTSLYLVKNDKSPLGRRAFLTHKLRQQAEKYSGRRLEEIIIEIAAADVRLRHKGVKPETTLEMLVMKLVGESRSLDG
ncbi:MAG: DNA polymerase III subunit delta [Candidatus Zixiibacteriota bacterium]|nr:MAG: DNA polymerase III subunit delta [candidate division Zixibacteria bacterium]